MKQYANYHKHDHVSNLFVPDVAVKCEDYLKRIQELGYDCYWTTNHGTGGDIFEARDLCDKYGIKCFYGLEGYIVPNPLEKDARNYHIIIIPKTNIARKKVNLITSHASEEGYYYKPRIFLKDLLDLDKDDIYITTACVAGILKDDDSISEIFEPLVNKFGKNVFLEVQNHNEKQQIEICEKCVEFSKKYGIEMIAANDSHYIYPDDYKTRIEFLKGKGIDYSDEGSYILDYPNYDAMYSRFETQGVLSKEQIERAIDNTRIFESCEEIKLDKEIKMPSAYPHLTPDEKIQELKSHINAKFSKIKQEENIFGDKLKEYIAGIRYEMQIIEDTKEINTADYFLLNEKIVDKAVNEYGGVLTRTGRGSCGSYYINRILGMTQIDRFTSPVKLYPERFISTARLLENRSTPDIDYNIASQEPFLKASQDVLGIHGVYPMIAYGTMQMGDAFRNVCRSRGIPFEEFNEVAKDVDSLENDPKWGECYKEAQKYVNTIVSVSPHPCAHAMDNKDLREEYGIVRVGNALCCMITSGEADYWKVLKDDFLIVSIWGIISDTFKMIGRPILTVRELLNDLDDRIWDIYANGITCTLNQVDSDYATGLMKRFKARTVGELAQFTAAVRPSFDAWRDAFIDRKPFTTGSQHLDEVLKETRGMITFQETLMTYFQWLGVTPAESIGLIKKISKKKIKPEDFNKLEERLKSKWIENTGSIDHFDETWNMVQGCMAYSFAAPHALATAIDSLYSAWLKVHYPLQYYSVVFGYYEGDMERTAKLTSELDYFGIKLGAVKFRYSGADYRGDEETNTIYKAISSIKYCNKNIGEILYSMKNTKFDTFVDFLEVNPCDTRQLSILIRLNFFAEFGKSQKLLKIAEVYDEYAGKVTIKKDKTNISRELLSQYCDKETEKQCKFTHEGMIHLIKAITADIPNTDIPLQTRLQNEVEYLGYIQTRIPDAKNTAAVMELDTKYSPKLQLYDLGTGEMFTAKISKNAFQYNPLVKGDIIMYRIEEKPKCYKDENGEWQKDETKMEKWLAFYGTTNLYS